MKETFDAIIVGSGAGGGTAARALTQRGWQVLVLEKGPWRRVEDFLPYDEVYFSEYKALTPPKADGNIYVDPADPTKSKPIERWWIGNMVGGSTMLWEANLPRYTEEDFTLSGIMPEAPKDASMPDWPWRYADWHPWFELAEWEWCVSGRANQSYAQEPTRPSYDYPMPPIRPHASTPFVMNAFARAGFIPYLSPRGINSRTFDSRPGCPFCGFCQGFGCAVNDRASSTNTVLARALRSGRCEIRTNHYVTRIVHEAGHVVGVEYITEPCGPRKVIKASRVFVSIQAIESARLFLLSEIKNPNIGRYLTYHTKGTAELTFPRQPAWDEGPDARFQPKTSLGSLQLRDLYVIRDKARPELSKGGKFSIYDPATVAPPIKCISKTGGRNGVGELWGPALVDRLVELREHGGVQFSFTGETMSVWDNRVELDRVAKDPWGVPIARVHYKHHDYDLKISQYCLERVVQIMVDAGGEVRKFEPQKVANEGYGHNHGTLRAGTDPGTSVLDENCQSHDVKGLYVLDCSFMPTAGASNPTLTLIANAFRVCSTVAKGAPPTRSAAKGAVTCT
nr:GMC family oxidoreductase [Azospirillum argentinense]